MNTSGWLVFTGSRAVAVLTMVATALMIPLFVAPLASAAGGETYAVTDIGDLSQTPCTPRPQDFLEFPRLHGHVVVRSS